MPVLSRRFTIALSVHLSLAAPFAFADDAPAAADSGDLSAIVVTASKTTQSSVALGGVQVQKLLPGISPLKAIETLPGVVYETADPWGNNEQNESLVIHGFTTQQLGYTMDGVPLGDQQYGNYNGLSVSRALISENTSRVELQSGAGSLGVASTSNLGGAIETYSSDPTRDFGVDVRETGGSYDTTRTFLRVDSGEFAAGTTAYLAYLHQDARAWDFDGHQRGDQVNLKLVHDDDFGKLTFGNTRSSPTRTRHPSVTSRPRQPPVIRPTRVRSSIPTTRPGSPTSPTARRRRSTATTSPTTSAPHSARTGWST
jgi:iron complex outermembrane receptor protein